MNVSSLLRVFGTRSPHAAARNRFKLECHEHCVRMPGIKRFRFNDGQLTLLPKTGSRISLRPKKNEQTHAA